MKCGQHIDGKTDAILIEKYGHLSTLTKFPVLFDTYELQRIILAVRWKPSPIKLQKDDEFSRQEFTSYKKNFQIRYMQTYSCRPHLCNLV
uniref:Uncharacterized protein n=1 Tax=Romanomermis culicivorax TaxID=13658 RepID=A0A915L802_ROMCU